MPREENNATVPGPPATRLSLFLRRGRQRRRGARRSPAMTNEIRTAIMTQHIQAQHLPRAETGIARAWRLVASFFSIAARSLPAAGV